MPRKVETGIHAGSLPVTVAKGPSSCAIGWDGAVTCSGCLGVLGTFDTIRVQGLPTPATAVAVGEACHACAIVQGDVWCWGANEFGQVGPTAMVPYVAPIRVPGIKTPVRAVSAGGFLSCAIDADGGVLCWGENNLGQLGTGSSAKWSSTPVVIQGLEAGVVALSARATQPCALTAAGAVLCWGYAGILPWQPKPTPVQGTPPNIVEIAGDGYGNGCLRTDDDRVYCWGWGSTALLGNGSLTDSAVPVLVTGF